MIEQATPNDFFIIIGVFIVASLIAICIYAEVRRR